jgi:1-acyl-sn-glycerol-3-phosphate acyltransferase
MKYILYWVFYPLIRPLYLFSVVINTLFLGTLIIILSSFDKSGNISHYIGKFWSLINVYLSGTRIIMYGKEKINNKQAYIIMANHQSLFDVWVLIGKLPLQIRWLVKKDIRSIPVFGYALERMGHIYIDRSDKSSRVHGLQEAAEKTKNKTSVIIFPEGTRSEDGKLLSFRNGGAMLALNACIPILPITINGSRFVLPKGTLDLMPGTIQIVVGDVIEPLQFEGKGMDELTVLVRNSIEQHLDLSFGRRGAT